ncbi:GNAT family N-acetyltransferase [Geomicrobium sediminis]|uniref:Amidohydrolase/ribosomal protein S18 acetylase RimI-like enzyme n=1 Tax=Geomicrobium sediminis TaxID=1347788 RepID=A0ABS2PBH0_9BACL|nr:GNAT family N-acetyltransferase [Geomicrobium sediminis]MBM7632425.1 putative amidohydrolase/ribosomal protein S18 acetylase RimI-like enzyme [Geomicrobium sediminis]
MSRELKIIVRQTTFADIDQIITVNAIGFGIPEIAFKRKHFESQLRTFPEGQVCVEYDGKIIGSCSSLIIDFEDYGEDHRFEDIADDGYIRNHNPNGRHLYGIEVVVHPDYRHMKIGRRLYEARQRICQLFNLESILFGGRLPNYHKYADQFSAKEYAEEVIKKNIYDPVLTFQLSHGFKLRKVLASYLKHDRESLEYASLMEWKNPHYVQPDEALYQRSLPVTFAASQYELSPISSFEDFAIHVENDVQIALEHHAQVIVFPELITLQWLSFKEETIPSKQARAIAEDYENYRSLFHTLAVRYNMNIFAGSTFVKDEGTLKNRAHLFHRNGTVDVQDKLHITIEEERKYGVAPGDELNIFETDFGKVSLMLGYDLQFPEIVRLAVGRGAHWVVVPFAGSTQASALEVERIAKARAIENQIFVVTSSLVGRVPTVSHSKMYHGVTGIYSPLVSQLSTTGVLIESNVSTGDVLVATTDKEVLRRERINGSWSQRRQSLYKASDLEVVHP